MEGISGTGQLDWEMPRGPSCLPRGPSGDPGRKPSGTQAWREPPGRDEELSRSSGPWAPSPVQGALSSLAGEELECPLSLPQLLSPLELGGVDHLLWGWAPQGGEKAKGFHTAPFRNHSPPNTHRLGEVLILFPDLDSRWQAGYRGTE